MSDNYGFVSVITETNKEANKIQLCILQERKNPLVFSFVSKKSGFGDPPAFSLMHH